MSGEWFIAIPLAPFSADDQYSTSWRPGLEGPAIIETSIQLEAVNLPATAVEELARQTFTFPVNPVPGYIDASVYLGGSHNPVDVTTLRFGDLISGQLLVQVVGRIVFEYELDNLRNHDFDFQVALERG